MKDEEKLSMSFDNARLLSVNSHRPIVPFKVPLH